MIDEFVSRYRREFDFYDQAGRIAAQLLETSLGNAGIRAIVTFRAKSPSRLDAKIRQRAPDKHYENLDAIYSDIVDLAGARVALYFPGERDQVDKLIRDLFFLTDSPKVFPDASRPNYKKRFSGYWATHYRIRLRESSLSEAQRRYSEAIIEIQVASVLMHAWAEVEHDLVYKPTQGQLSEDEYAILDELNGLVLAGEIALERLQKAGEARVAAGGRHFSSHYELAAYLLDKAAPVLKGPVPETALGRVDLLYALLEKLDLATPDQIAPYIDALSSDTERRPLAEQIVDHLISEDESRYLLYDNLKAARDRDASTGSETERLPSTNGHQAIGYFLSKWIELERLIRQIVLERTGEQTSVLPTTRLLQQIEVLNPSARAEIESIRRIRNNLVHGVEIPDPAYIRDAAERLEHILKELRGHMTSGTHPAP
jgi:ppGpp synthetase/RelA/SpoT-type nucleotidyltranferase